MPKLIIMQPDKEPVTFELTDDSATIGRAPENSIPLEGDVGCSRRHCQILKISSGFELTDMKSRNGTKVNGVKRDRHVLSDGDVIEIGKTRITFREREGAEEEVVLEDFGGGAGGRAGGDCHLVFLSGDRKKEKIVLSSDRTTFGRKDSNTVVLKDNMVSSYHCEVTKEAGGYVLRDLGSTNGSAVNGEQVSETALNHGARVRLGKTSFVFVDPAMADYESTLEKEEDAESEWGMMRAQVDFGRVKRARRASLIWLGVFVILLGGAAYCFITRPAWLRDVLPAAQTASVTPVKDNVLDDFSFEEGVSWLVPEGKKGGASVVKGSAHQGDSVLSLIGPDEAGEPAIAYYVGSQDGQLSVVANRKYEFSIWAKKGPKKNPAGAMILWELPGSEAVQRFSATEWAKEGDWQQLEVVAVAPEGAITARLGVVVLGPGSAQFDDAVFRESEESQTFPNVRIDSAGYTLDIGDTGALSVSRSGQFFLWNGGFVGLGEQSAVVTQEMCFRPDSITPADGGARISGHLALPDGETIGATVVMTPQDDRLAIEYSTDGPAEGLDWLGYGFRVSREYLSEGATLSGEEGAGPIHAETDQLGVRKIILGGKGTRLSLIASEPAKAKMISSGGLRLALLGPPAGATRSLELVTDFTKERIGASALLQEAQRAMATGDKGQAMLLFGRVVNEYPFDDHQRSRAEAEMRSIRKEGDARLAAVESTFEGAKKFFDVGDLKKALNGGESLVEDYAGYKPIVEPAEQLTSKVRDRLKNIQDEAAESEAERLYLRYMDFKKGGRTHLAAAFLKELETRYPNAAATARAREE